MYIVIVQAMSNFENYIDIIIFVIFEIKKMKSS